MYLTIFTDEYDKNTESNLTNNCTNNENNIDIIIPTLSLRIPCGVSLLCLMSSMVYTLIEPVNKFT